MEHAEYAEFINHLLTKEILRSFNGFFWTTFSGYENYSQIEKLFYTDFYNKHKKLNKYLSIQTNLYKNFLDQDNHWFQQIIGNHLTLKQHNELFKIINNFIEKENNGIKRTS